MPRRPKLVLAALTALAATAALVVPAIHPAHASAVRSVAEIRTASAAGIFGGGLWNDPSSQAAQAVASLRSAGRWDDARLESQIANQPVATWLGEWFTGATLTSQVSQKVNAAAAQNRTAVFVTYAVPNRDCGSYSSGGMDLDSYLSWNRTLAAALTGKPAAVVVEPDGLAMLTGSQCPGEAGRRIAAIKGAVDILSAAGVPVYIDAGHSGWVSPETMASLLESVDVERARGFATNVSNYRYTSYERAYADRVSQLTGGSHYVVDVSRNGAGWKGDWCNPGGAALGMNPRVVTTGSHMDAALWIKTPGASDGTCNGGPSAGQWWDSYALMLVRNRMAL